MERAFYFVSISLHEEENIVERTIRNMPGVRGVKYVCGGDYNFAIDIRGRSPKRMKETKSDIDKAFNVKNGCYLFVVYDGSEKLIH